jgi:hypothetical protein
MDGRILPEGFALAYEMLWVRALGDGGPGAGVGNHPLNGSAGTVGVAGRGAPGGKVENAGWRLSSGQTDAVGRTAGPQKKPVGKTSRTLKDERAFRFKQKIDRELRRLGKKIEAFEDGRNIDSAGQRVCTGRCKRFGDADWAYCPVCAGPMREVERDE